VGVLDTLIKEAEEEASLPEDIVRTQAVAAGAVSYFYIRDASAGGEEGLLQPEVQYVHDLAITEDIIPKPNDDEVEAFSLMPLHEVLLLSIG
jgi:8-oxo-dGTP pyrophosphatase MutT (NUDIX family)